MWLLARRRCFAAAAAAAATSSSIVTTSAATLRSPFVLRTGSANLLLGGPTLQVARGLRGGRGELSRRRAAQAVLEYKAAARRERRRQPRPPQPAPLVPSYIRVRDLAKVLKQPVETVLKHVATRRDRRFHMTMGGDRFEFKNIKQIILPFDFAQRVAAAFNMSIRFDDVEPTFLTFPERTDATPREHVMRRNPVIAVMGHVDHGKTTLMDTLRNSSIAQHEVQGITQKINICEAELLGGALRATFLDTPGHFHFFRMRTNAAQVADLVLLVVAGDEGCLLQTEESIGAIEDAGIPVIACINKMDVTLRERMDAVRDEIRSYVALQTCPIIEISGKTGENVDVLSKAIAEMVMDHSLDAHVGPDIPAQGIVLESIVKKGRGIVLRVLLKSGVLTKGEHFVAGMIHGVVRSITSADSGETLSRAVPGMVVDVMFANKSKNVDAPIEFGFFALPEARAKQVIEQRQLAMDLAENVLPRDDDDADEDESLAVTTHDDQHVDEDNKEQGSWVREPRTTKSIIVKADGAGSLTSIQDTVDQMEGITTVRIGIGHVTTHDIDVAINQDCPIFGFNIRLRKREQRLAAARGVRVILRSTIHDLVREIEQFQTHE